MDKEETKLKCKSDIADLMLEYDKFKEKYNLPEFSELNEAFDIEEICSESEFLLRRIRRAISEKLTGYLRFIEVIINPNNTPLFFFKFIKKLNEEDKKSLAEIYESLGLIELELVKLDLNYNELNEAKFIKRISEIVNKDISKRLLNILEIMINEIKEQKEDKKSYFG